MPDEGLYAVKLAIEKSLLVLVSPSYIAKGTLEMKYTERRFNETKRLLASKQSVEGLPYLNAQVASTKTVIEQAPDTKVQAQLAKNYIDTLTSVSSQLEEQKRALAASPAPSSASVTPTTPKTTPPAAAGSKPLSPTPPLPTAVVTNAPPPAAATAPTTPVAVTEITQTQEAIAAAISDLQRVAREVEKEEKKEDKGNRREGAGNDHGFQEDRRGNSDNRGRGEE